MRSKFRETGPIPITEIRLDQNNYRLGPLDSQIECIEIIFKRFGPKITKIAGHIAKNGLSPKPIVVSKDNKKRWVVLDGNRRVTALKLLNNPAEAPDNYKRSFREIKKNATSGMIPDKIDCLTADKATILEYRKLEHLGLQGGIGQDDWDARAKENLQAEMDGQLSYPLAGAICDYLVGKGINEAGRVTITGMQRLFQDTEISRRIGFLWDGQNLYFTAKEKEVFNVLKTIIYDFTKARDKKTVGDIYNPKDRETYINKLFKRKNIKEPTPLPKPVPPSGKPRPTGETPSTSKTPAKRTHPWDRARVIKRGMGLSVPDKETKLNSVLVELSFGVNVRDATIAAGVLVRIVLERSVDYYIKENGINSRSDKLHVRINEAALRMKTNGVINKKQLQQLQKMRNSEQLISAHTLNQWVHNPTYSPVPREVCTFWDNIYFFLVECWK